MSIDISKLAAASFMPGLQNSGQVSGTALINGILYPSPLPNTSNMTNTLGQPIVISLPDPSVISLFRVNLPDANGDLASKWFPLIGTCELTDNTAQWRLILYELSDPAGRSISFNFVNLKNAQTNFTNFRINIYGHLFTYPWSQ